MTEDIYRKLQEHFHQYPIGYPATKSGVEIALLKKMFEKEEAEIALAMTPKPESPEEIALRLRYDPKELAQKLYAMSRRGLIMRRKEGDKVRFHLEPYVHGMDEYMLRQVFIGKRDKEFINLDNQYQNEAFGAEFFRSKTSYFRIIPVEENIPTESVILPHQKISEYIEKAEGIAVLDCVCRTRAKMLGKGCSHTVQNCFAFSPVAEFSIENGWPGRMISKEEALEILAQTEEEGLVHMLQNAATGPWVMCNCCSCSCGVLRVVKNYKRHGWVSRSYYFAKMDEELCVGCESCIDRCQFGALSMKEGIAQVNEDYCMGCGLCVSTCSTGAISLIRKPEELLVSPPPDLETLYAQIGKEKGRTEATVEK